MIGRRPNRSDSAPRVGENRNWPSAQTVPNRPTISAARTVSLSRNERIRRGSTGMIMPSASMSSITVTKTKATAARRGRCRAVAGAAAGIPAAGSIGSGVVSMRLVYARRRANAIAGLYEPGPAAGAGCATPV